MLTRLRDRGRDEGGAVLVMVALMMIVFLGVAALAIDLGSFDQAQTQAQSAADAGALAAARGLPATSASVNATVQSYVQMNDPQVPQTLLSSPACITATPPTPGICIVYPYNGNSSNVQVKLNVSAPSLFGHVLGVTQENVSATAVANEKPGSGPCVTPGTGCYAIFAKDSSCSDDGVSVGGGTHISGGVNSNGSINVGGGGSSFGPTTYGSGCTVSPSGYQQQSNTFTTGPASQAATLTWPIDYSTDFPACTGAACTGPGGTPSFCTQSATANETLYSYYPYTLTSGNIYCDVGTGNARKPTTWNGSITVDQSGSTPIESSYVGGSVTLGGGDNLTACGYSSSGYTASGCHTGVPTPPTTNYPLIYAVGSGTPINESGGGGSFSGDMFAPNGTINIGGGTATTFLEAKDVTASGGALTGDGPEGSGAGSASSGSESLLQ